MPSLSAPFWEQPLRHWQDMFQAGLRARLVASRLAVPLMLPRRKGLIINTVPWDRDLYLGSLFYDVAKAAIIRMDLGMAIELREHGVAAVALDQGFVRTERAIEAHAANPSTSAELCPWSTWLLWHLWRPIRS